MITSQSRKEPHHSFYTAERKKLRCSFRVKTKTWEINTSILSILISLERDAECQRTNTLGLGTISI